MTDYRQITDKDFKRLKFELNEKRLMVYEVMKRNGVNLSLINKSNSAAGFYTRSPSLKERRLRWTRETSS